MDTALNTASAVAGLLSLTVQITQVMQRHIWSVAILPRAVATYLEELVCLKKLLVDVQDALLLQSPGLPPSGLVSITTQALPVELAEFQSEMEQLYQRLRKVQQSPTASMLKSFAWPFRDDEIARWANSLSLCRHRIQAAFVISGLRVQLMTLGEIRELKYKSEVVEKEERRLRILDWIFDNGMRRKHRELTTAHHPNTGRWIFNTPEFRNWIEDETSTLWCYGNPGVGKTQLASLVVDYLCSSSSVVYFYCDYQTTRVQSVTGVAASLLRQLVETESALPPTLEELYKTLGNGRDKLKLDDIAILLQSICLDRPRVHIVLDALDEFGPAVQRRRVLSLLKRLADASAKIFITSRPHLTDVGRSLGNYIELEIKSDVTDIRAYVEHMIHTNDELSELIQDDLKDEAVQRVTDKADGMFLLASLQCIHLSHLVRVSEVKQALKELPSGLESAYQGSLQRIGLESPERKSIAMTTLSWIYHSQRPLSIGELLHALAVDDTESLLNDEAVPPRNVIIGTCAGLVIFDAERDIVRFVHYSVHEYFKATYQRCFPNARVDITKTCFAYLRLENLAYDESASREAVDRLLSSYPFLKYAAQHWGSHAKDGFHRNMNGIALAFLENQSRVVLAAHLLDEDSMSANQTAPMFPSTNLPVQLSARFGALAIMHLLLERGHGLVGADTSGRTALHWAARGGFGDVVKAILRGGVDLGAKTRDGRTPLHWAAKHGHPHVVAELIRHGANPAEPTADGRTALHWAASRGHRSVVETLLSDARVHAACQSRNGWTALHWAACSGKRAVVTYGLDHLNLESPQTSCREHLSMSGGEPKGHEEVTMLLLKAEVSPHTRNGEGQTALHLAAASGNKKVAQRLLDYGADMGAQDTHGYTPWHFAVDNGVEDTIAAMFSTSTGSVVGSAATTCQS